MSNRPADHMIYCGYNFSLSSEGLTVSDDEFDANMIMARHNLHQGMLFELVQSDDNTISFRFYNPQMDLAV